MPLDAILHSFLLVAAGEVGDKTQLLAFMLASRFRKPLPVLAGIFIATILNHALAASAGVWLAAQMNPLHLKVVLAGIFFAFALWVLIPDKEDDGEIKDSRGAFVATVIAFFVAEMGDKTQLATIALGARFDSLWQVTLGTTLGMMFSSGLAVIFGEKLAKWLPLNWIRLIACVLFALFGAAILAA